jgi:lysophospholipase L1-like esterase
LIGTNDCTGGGDAPTIFSTTSALFDEIRADGNTLIPFTLTPHGNAGTPTKTCISALNALIVGYANTNSLKYIDTYAMFDDGTGNLKAAYDSGDGLHPNQAANDLLSTAIAASGVLH